MNCKQGDLAIIVRGMNAGKIVDVMEFAGESPVFVGVRWNVGMGPNWIVKAKGTDLITEINTRGVKRRKAYSVIPCLDSHMRPIRPSELDDETEDNLELETI